MRTKHQAFSKQNTIQYINGCVSFHSHCIQESRFLLHSKNHNKLAKASVHWCSWNQNRETRVTSQVVFWFQTDGRWRLMHACVSEPKKMAEIAGVPICLKTGKWRFSSFNQDWGPRNVSKGKTPNTPYNIDNAMNNCWSRTEEDRGHTGKLVGLCQLKGWNCQGRECWTDILAAVKRRE